MDQRARLLCISAAAGYDAVRDLLAAGRAATVVVDHAPTVADAVRQLADTAYDLVLIADARAARSALAARDLLATTAPETAMLVVAADRAAEAELLAADVDVVGAGELLAPVLWRALKAGQRQRRLSTRVRRLEQAQAAACEMIAEGMWRVELAVPLPIDGPEDAQLEHLYAHGTLAAANRQLVAQLAGADGDALIGAPLERVWPRGEPQRAALLRELLRSGYRRATATIEWVDRDGRSRYAETTLVGHVEHGQLEQIVGAQRDVTVERQVEQLSAELSALRASTEYIVAGSALDGTIQSWNVGAERLLGYAADEVIGRSLLMLVPPEDVANTVELISRAAAGEQLGHIDVVIQRKDGARSTISLAVLPVRDRAGAIVGTVGIGRDITAQQAAADELARSRQHFANVLEHSRDAIFQLNLRTGKYDYGSPSITDVLGYSLTDMLSDSYETTLGLIHEDDRPHVLRANEALAKNIAGESSASEIEYRMLTLHRGLRWISESRRMIRDDAGQPLFVVGNLRDVTDRIELLEAIQISEQRYRHIVEMTQEGIFTVELPSRISFVNQRAAEILGYTPAEMIGQSLFDLLPEPVVAEAKVQLARRQAGRPAEYEVQMRRKDGQLRWCHFSATPIRDGEGRITGSVGMVRDITSRKRAEHALRASEAGLNRAQRLAHLGSFTWNPQTEMVQWSDELYRILGWAPQMVVPSFDLFMTRVHPDDRALVEQMTTVITAGGDPPSCTYRIVRPDGEVRTIEVHQEIVNDVAGESLVSGTLLDITERSQTEQALQRSQEQLEVALRSARIGLWEWFIPSNSVRYAPTWKRQLGYADHEIPNEPREWEIRVHPDDLAESWTHIGKQLAGTTGDFETTHRLRHRDGSYRWIMSRGAIQRDAAGAALRVLAINVDITDLKLAETALLRTADKLRLAYDEQEARVQSRTLELVAAKEEAERANAAKSEFLSRMSHELRTPMNSILGFAQIMEMDALSPKQTERVGYILKAGRHLLELINEVLDVTRVEAGYLAVVPEPVPIFQALAASLDLIRPLARQRDLRISFTAAAEELYIQADQQRLSQVLLNLLSNATKYNRVGGEILVAAHRSGSAARIEVRDTGAGIAAGDLGKLFAPFERLGVTDAVVEGTGLGLALSKRLVELMGGALGVESVLGQGSCFWLEFPLTTPHAAAVTSAAVSVPAPPPAGQTLVYIEDNLANIQVVEHVLAELPHLHLVTAMQGQLGLELVREVRPDLVLLDLHLPDISGSEVLRRLRADAATADIPVVIISADAAPQRRPAVLAAGADEYLAKPFDVRRFLDVVAALLSRSAAR